MSVTPFGLDSPDWVRNQGAGAALVVNDSTVTNGSPLIGRFYVGGWSSLIFFVAVAGVSPQGYQATISFFENATDPVPFIQTAYEVWSNGKETHFVLPCYGPFIEIQYLRMNGAGLDTINTRIVGSPTVGLSYAGVLGRPLLTINNFVMGAGTFPQFDLSYVTQGMVTLSIKTANADWFAIVQVLDNLGNLTYTIGGVEPARFTHAMGQFVLPAARCRLVIANGAGAGNPAYGSLTLNWSS